MSQVVYPPTQVAYGNPYPAQPMQAGAPVTIVTQPQVIATGNCPACHTGHLTDEYGLPAICLAIIFFPIGILCCLAMKERRCTHCRAGF